MCVCVCVCVVCACGGCTATNFFFPAASSLTGKERRQFEQSQIIALGGKVAVCNGWSSLVPRPPFDIPRGVWE